MKKIVYLLGVSCLFSLKSNAQITTVAGTGTGGHAGDGGAATAAQLFAPMGLALDGSGNVYIADQYNNAVRKLSSSGTLTTIAGTFTAGYSGDSSAATAAKLSGPTGVAVDAAGNVYIADRGNNRIRKVNAAGVITTIAGTGAAGYNGDGILATAAKIKDPFGLAIDKKGNVIFTEAAGSRVRKINSAGVVSTIAGTGAAGYNTDNWPTSTLAMVNRPAGLAVDAQGNIIFADQFNNMIRKIDTNNIISTLAGKVFAGFCDNQPGTIACLNYPSGVSIDDQGNVYIADGANYRLVVLTPDGFLRGTAGTSIRGYSGDGGIATQAKLTEVNGVAVDGAGNAYVSDWGNNRIRRVVTTVGVANVNKREIGEVEIYPNPVSAGNSFTVVINSVVSEQVMVSVQDITGRIVTEMPVATNVATEIKVDLPTGLYVLSAANGQATVNRKLEVVR